MPLFGTTSPIPIRPSPTGRLIGTLLALSAFSAFNYFGTINARCQIALARRTTQAREMEVLRAQLNHYHHKLKNGEVVSEQEMEEGEKMEKLFRRWIHAMENDVDDYDKGRSALAKFDGWPGLVGVMLGSGLSLLGASLFGSLRMVHDVKT